MESELNSKGIVDLCWGTGVFFLCFCVLCVCVSGVLVRVFLFFCEFGCKFGVFTSGNLFFGSEIFCAFWCIADLGGWGFWKSK